MNLYRGTVGETNRQAAMWWTVLAVLALLSVCLGLLQYRWLGEISRADGDRLQSSLQSSLNRLSEAFNAELTRSAAALLPDQPLADQARRHQRYAERFLENREQGRGFLFRSLSLAVPEGDSVQLYRLDPRSGRFLPAAWPGAWQGLRERFERRDAARDLRQGPRLGPENRSGVFEIPVFELRGRELRGRDQPPRELEWLIFEPDLEQFRTVVLPDFLQRYLGESGIREYHAQVFANGPSATRIFDSDSTAVNDLSGQADASVPLFDLRMDILMRRFGPFGGGGGVFGKGGRPEPGGEWRPRGLRERVAERTGGRGQWTLFVRHREGSIDAVVTRARTRNLAISIGILVLILAAAGTLIQFTRRSQAVAELQMQFVASVSHELRTPLTVVRTAGHNLQGRVSSDSARVQQYGALIEAESGNLSTIVEQVLQFSNAKAGRVIGTREPVQVGDLLHDALEADRKMILDSGCQVDVEVAPGLPCLLGDFTTLKLALQNLVSNAAKYGKEGGWIRISALCDSESNVEIRIADRGPGISREELGQIFDPFYRGRRAIAEQIHGTGLGLSLVKKIVEAHDGTVTVHSKEGEGTEFVVRIPALAATEDECKTAVS